MWAEGTVDGKYVRRSLKTKSWEKATRINKEIDESQNPDPKPKDEPVSVVQAVEEYLADAKARELGEATLYKLEIIFRKQLLTWARQKDMSYCGSWTFALCRLSERRGKMALFPKRRSRRG